MFCFQGRVCIGRSWASQSSTLSDRTWGLQPSNIPPWSSDMFRHGCGKMQGLFDFSRWLWWLWWHSFILFRGSDLFGDLRFDNFCCWLLSALEEWWKSSLRQRSDSMLMKSGQIRLVRGQSESHWELVNQLVLECDWHTLFYNVLYINMLITKHWFPPFLS